MREEDSGDREGLVPESSEWDDRFRRLLEGEPEALPAISRFFRKLPAPPRCKSCNVPFAGPYAPILRVFRWSPWPLNAQLCRWCYQGMAEKQGGAEVPVSLLFTDVRGSTSLAERMSSTEFRSLMDRFFKTVFRAVDAEHGVIDHIVGDAVMAMWTPAFGGKNHAGRAVAAGRALLVALGSDEVLRESVPAGVGVHTGIAWVGVVGEPGAHDFTVLGDAPNTAARLGSAAGGGELALSGDIVEAAGVDTAGLEKRTLELKGKSDSVTVWFERTAG